MVLTSPLKLATYTELDTICSTDDLYNMLEIIEAKEEFDDISRTRSEQQQANTQ